MSDSMCYHQFLHTEEIAEHSLGETIKMQMFN